jgi:hypothetical protein
MDSSSGYKVALVLAAKVRTRSSFSHVVCGCADLDKIAPGEQCVSRQGISLNGSLTEA